MSTQFLDLPDEILLDIFHETQMAVLKVLLKNPLCKRINAILNSRPIVGRFDIDVRGYMTNMYMRGDIKHMIEKVNNLGSLHPLQQFPNVMSVDFNSEFNGDISDLKNYPNLREIRFGSSFNRSIDVFEEEELRELKVIIFDSAFNQSIEPLRKLKNLIYLDLSGGNFKQSIKPIVGCTNIQTVFIRGGKEIRSLKKISSLKKIVMATHFSMEEIASYYGFSQTTTAKIHIRKLF